MIFEQESEDSLKFQSKRDRHTLETFSRFSDLAPQYDKSYSFSIDGKCIRGEKRILQVFGKPRYLSGNPSYDVYDLVYFYGLIFDIKISDADEKDFYMTNHQISLIIVEQ